MRVLLDANLATLLVLGSADRRTIGTHKRIQGYTRRDYDDLTTELSQSDAIVFLPNTLTEVSNLVGFGVTGTLRTTVYNRLRQLIDRCEERYVRSSSASERDEFRRLGLTDSALLSAGNGDLLLLTDDNGLYLAAVTAGYRARNFRHIQAER